MENQNAVLRWLKRVTSPARSPRVTFTFAIALTALTAATAQTPPLAALPAGQIAPWAEPSAQVPPVVYRSVFADTPMGVETQSTDWKKANAEVGQFSRGHVDILKWEEAQTQKQVPVPTQHKH